MSKGVLKKFYNSPEWAIFRQSIIVARTKEQGRLVCDECGEPIIDTAQMELHHIIHLTPDNVSDVNITLNPSNIAILHRHCHNKIHNRFCGGKIESKSERGIYLVYGPPMAGKSKFVAEHMERGDLVVDIDRIFQAISGLRVFDKPDQLKYNAFAVQNLLFDNIKTRYGGFRSAWIVGGFADKYRREKLAADLGAELIYIKADEADCVARLRYANDYRQAHAEEWEAYIAEWFRKFIP